MIRIYPTREVSCITNPQENLTNASQKREPYREVRIF